MNLKVHIRTLRDALTSPWGSLLRVRTDQPCYALTFDDGPDYEQTPAILDALDAAGARATFFMLLTRARAQPDLVRNVLAGGHEIGLHGLNHRRLTSGTTEQALAEIAAGKRELEDLIAGPVRYFRPPYGAQSLAIWRGIGRLGCEVVLWGPSLWDWKDTSEANRTARALLGFGPGAIVLGHDGIADVSDGADPACPPDLDRASWAAAMLARYADLGLRSVTVSELLATGRPVRAARFAT